MDIREEIKKIIVQSGVVYTEQIDAILERFTHLIEEEAKKLKMEDMNTASSARLVHDLAIKDLSTRLIEAVKGKTI